VYDIRSLRIFFYYNAKYIDMHIYFFIVTIILSYLNKIKTKFWNISANQETRSCLSAKVYALDRPCI